MKSGILWDNDGVLVDTEGLFYEANRELFAEHGIHLTHQHFFDWFLCDNIGAWHLLEARGMTQSEIAILRDDRNQRYSQRLQAGRDLVIDGVQDVLRVLGARTRMGIVTSSRLDHFNMIHDKLDLLQHFEFVVAEGDYAASKPAPDPYLLGLKKLALPAEQCIVIEDSPRGMCAAITAGLRCIVLRNELSRHYAFDDAYCVVDSYAELGYVVVDILAL
jgi:HAD superfamily hydrolase (TIGR01509 family)